MTPAAAPAPPENPAHPAHPAGPLLTGVPTGLPWLAIALISALIVAATVAAGWFAWIQTQQRIAAELHASAFAQTQRLADWHQERLAIAGRLQHRNSLERLWVRSLAQPAGERQVLLDQFLVSYADAPSIARIELFDAGLSSVWDSARQPSIAHPVLQQGLQTLLAQRRAGVVGPWRDAQGRVRLAYVGLLDPPGQPPALVALHVDPPAHFHAALLQWPLPYTRASARLYTLRDGAVQHWSDLPAGQNPAPGFDPEHALAQRLLRGEVQAGQLVSGQDDLGHPALAMLHPVPGTDWWVQIDVDRTELLARLHYSLVGIGLLGLLALLLALSGAHLLLQRNQLASSQRSLDALQRAHRALATSEARSRLLSQATEQSPAAVIVTDAQGQIEYVNPAFERISGYCAAEVLGRNPRLLQSSRTPKETYRQMWDALGRGQTWQGEFINTHKDGSHYHTSMTVAPLRDAAQRVLQYVSVQMDLSAQRAVEQQVELLAWFDPLTGLPNRQRLLAELPQILHPRPGNGEQAGLLIVNVDRFKAINDARGRHLGDAVLRALADRLRLHLSSGEVLAHLSGDEFALLLPHLGHEAPAAASSLLRRAASWHQMLEQPLEAAGEPLRITLSIGATLLGEVAAEQPSEALRRADTALHQAKEAGGNQTVFFDSRMGQWVAERFALEQELRHGIEQGELRLYLQPQVDAQGQTVSAEALVRWQHPQRGLLSPALFIPLAEESGLIEALGRWVLEQVCGWLGRLQAQGRRLPISVNISPRQFQQSDFGARLQELLQRSQARPGDLMLEFTESVVLHDLERVIERMAALARLGLRFSIDDFGTGYSSLSYLKNLPIHELKIDRSFVQDAPHSPSDAALVAAMLAVASLMKLQVVAEGVETEEQSLLFRHHPGALMQGYLFGRPEPAEELIGRWLAATATPDTQP